MDDADQSRMAESRKKIYVESSLTCDSCYAAEACKMSKPGSVCALIPTFAKMESRDVPECIGKIKEVISTLEARAWRNYYFEQLDGGVADKNVTGLMESLIDYHKLLAELYNEVLPRQQKVTIEGSDVLEKIFGARNVNVPLSTIPAEVVKDNINDNNNSIVEAKDAQVPKRMSPLANSLRDMMNKRNPTPTTPPLRDDAG